MHLSLVRETRHVQVDFDGMKIKGSGTTPMQLVDLFCGIGGASCGARDAGVDVALAVDADPEALAVHKLNHPKCDHLCISLPRDSLPLPEGAIHIHASPPCQAFSQANRAVGRTRQRNALHLVEWAVRYCQSHGTTWSLEQVGSVAVCELLHEMGVAFDVFHFQDLGVPQTRRRVIAGSLEIVQALRDRAGQSRRPLSVQDVIPNCRGSHVKNATTSTWQVRGGARVQIPLTRDHPSFARPVSQPAYTVTGSSPLRWYTPDTEGCTMFSPLELMLVQGFPASYKLHQRRGPAYQHVGNAIPPPIVSLIVAAAPLSRQNKAFRASQEESRRL